MTYYVLSIIGIISANRIICRIEKSFFINHKNSLTIFVFLTTPIYIFLIIKDHYFIFILYIGLILISLIFFSIFLEKKLQNVFLTTHLNLINGLILQIKSGHSVQKAISESFLQMNNFEMIIYEPLRSIQKSDLDIKRIPQRWIQFYFFELQQILSSEIRVSDQLEMFKQGLKVKNRFIQRTSQVSLQIKAQALVACLVYALIFALSYYQLDLISSPWVIFFSLVMLFLGLILIFKIGGKIKWKI